MFFYIINIIKKVYLRDLIFSRIYFVKTAFYKSKVETRKTLLIFYLIKKSFPTSFKVLFVGTDKKTVNKAKKSL